MSVYVTRHACARFIEHCKLCSFAEAQAAILSHGRALEAAADFGCQVVRLADGSRLILEGNAVVTVYARGIMPRQCRSPFYPGGEERPL